MEVKAYEIRRTAMFTIISFFFPFLARLMQLKDEHLSFYFIMIRWNINIDVSSWAVPLVDNTSRVPAHTSIVLGWHSAPYQTAVN